MTRLTDIPINVTSAPPSAPDPTPSVLALLHEIDEALATLARTDEPAAIDLRAIASSPAARERLQQTLGRGEVHASIEALGTTEITETALACVWWTSHRDPSGELLAEQIDICEAPALLRADRADVPAARDSLKERMGLLARRDAPSINCLFETRTMP
jgi:hypothetical protein